MVRTVRRRMATLLTIPAVALGAVAVAAPGSAVANAPGPGSISGCWSWDVENGCTQWAECYVYGSHYTCFVTENFHGFVYTYTTSG